jgi:hypothetical protein
MPMHRWGYVMSNKGEIEIAFRAEADEAKALLRFLRCVSSLEAMDALDNRLDDVQAFKAAREKLNAALRKVVEPGSGE